MAWRGRAFTLIEVLIAIIVLAVGVVGVIALVPTAVKTATTTSDSLAASEHARSVVEALRLAARDHYHEVWGPDAAGTGREVKSAFLLLPHPAALGGGGLPQAFDSSKNLDPKVFEHRACILLPHQDGNEKIFVYPRVGSGSEVAGENGQGNALNALDDFSDRPGEPEVRATYVLERPAGEVVAAPYSFALAVRRAKVGGVAQSGLYLVRVSIYKGHVAFDKSKQDRDATPPVSVFHTELMVGPVKTGG